MYSRKSGRLIKHIPDARHILGVNSGGTDFCQGLTIIFDDVTGMLPLTPTKQDFAFGHEKNGEIHQDNLYNWIGAYTSLYYQKKLEIYTKKGTLKEVVAGHLADVQANDNRDIQRSLLDGRFNTYVGLRFSRLMRSAKIRCPKSVGDERVGEDTLVRFKIPEPEPQQPEQPRPVVRHQPQPAVHTQPPTGFYQQAQAARVHTMYQRAPAAGPQPNAIVSGTVESNSRQQKRPRYEEDSAALAMLDPPVVELLQDDDFGFEANGRLSESTTASAQVQQLESTASNHRRGPPQDQLQVLDQHDEEPEQEEERRPSIKQEPISDEIDALKKEVSMWKEKYTNQADKNSELLLLIEEHEDKHESNEAEIIQLQRKFQEARDDAFKEVEEKERNHRARYAALQKQLNEHIADSIQQTKEMEERYDKQQSVLREQLRIERELVQDLKQENKDLKSGMVP